jgi:hypothetical protein
LRAKFSVGVGSGVEHQRKADRFGAEGSGQFQGEAGIGGRGVGSEFVFFNGAVGVTIDDELDIGVWQGKQAGAIGAWGTDFRVEGGGEKLSGCRTFDGKTRTIEEDLGRWGRATGEVQGAFESACPPEECTSQENNDPRVGDDKSCVMALPRPAGGGGADQVETEKNEPKIEPGGTVHVGTGHAGAETGFKEGGGGANSGQGDEKEHRKVKRA